MPRPKSFDPDTVLTKAMGVFWEKGYDAASISDLTAAMGINRFSLYDTFGDKHELYLKALDAYTQSVVEPMIQKINAISTLDELQAYFSMMIDAQHACTCSPCCMMHKAAISQAPSDEATRKRVECARNRVHTALCDALTRIKSTGQLRADINIVDAAWILKITLAGLASYATSPIPAPQAKAALHLLLDSIHA